MKKWNVLSSLEDRSGFIDTLLRLRGISEKKDAELFLNPPSVSSYLEGLEDEFKESLEESKRIIRKSISKRVPIIIYGDYDVDGICATAILFNVITKELKYDNCHTFIPNRFDHGYGLSEKSLNDVVESVRHSGGSVKDALLITVDTGITAVEEVEYAKSLGFKIIITDHHQKPSVVPAAGCIVWSDEIVGSGISWILGRALGSNNDRSIGFVGLATVADLQPLIGMNRAFVKEGLDVLNDNPPLGIRKLVEVSKRSGDVDTYTLGWIIGPRINAAGRMGDADIALTLLTTGDEREAKRCANKLNKLNFERQKKTEQMYDIARELVAGKLPKVIVTKHSEYHEGIIGLVAAKLVQNYYRPSIVLSLGDGYGKGSVRSVPGVDIISLLREFEDIFESLGGHPMAAGFTIKRSRIDVLMERVESTQHSIDDNLLVPSLDVDLEIPINIVDLDLISDIEKLQPFGVGNKEPVFMSRDIGVTGISAVGKEKKHLSINLFRDGRKYRAIYFNGVESAPNLNVGDVVDIAYVVRRDSFRGVEKASIVVKDLRLSGVY